MDYTDYKIGDTVSCHYKKAYNSKKTYFAKGFITESFIMDTQYEGYGFWGKFKNKAICKTTFSYKSGSGTKRFYKKDLRTHEVLLVEKLSKWVLQKEIQ